MSNNYLHARLVPVVAEADDDEALLLGEDGLVHRPPGVQVRQQVRHLRAALAPPVRETAARRDRERNWSLGKQRRGARGGCRWDSVLGI